MTDEEVMKAIFGGGGKRSNILPEAQTATLREVAAVYGATLADGCQFDPGNVIVLRPPFQGVFKMRNSPCVVLEVFEEPMRNFAITHPTHMGEHAFGGNIDMRIAYVDDDGTVMTYCVESFRFEPYNGAAPEA